MKPVDILYNCEGEKRLTHLNKDITKANNNYGQLPNSKVVGILFSIN